MLQAQVAPELQRRMRIRHLQLLPKKNRRSTASDLSVSSFSYWYDRFKALCTDAEVHGVYARKLADVPLPQLTVACAISWSREHALWDTAVTVVLCDVFRTSPGLVCILVFAGLSYVESARVPVGHQENNIERYRYGGAGWFAWGGIILWLQN
ncbi:hypothetical protein AVEN_169261-1 [Araneus ventricosus]|uniref:Uncharacterized protein n=1 Tax=Araneus ventricosus TaxID=182803 RepID=A0A4Y2URJ7_ARAVE|nr:hypothetical protein AVEN_169261-1 [Araneus ventricosus]